MEYRCEAAGKREGPPLLRTVTGAAQTNGPAAPANAETHCARGPVRFQGAGVEQLKSSRKRCSERFNAAHLVQIRRTCARVV